METKLDLFLCHPVLSTDSVQFLFRQEEKKSETAAAAAALCDREKKKKKKKRIVFGRKSVAEQFDRH